MICTGRRLALERQSGQSGARERPVRGVEIRWAPARQPPHHKRCPTKSPFGPTEVNRLAAAAVVCLTSAGCQEGGTRFGVVNQCDTAIEIDSNADDPGWYFVDVGQARKSRLINKDQDSIKVWIRRSGSDGSPDPITVPVGSLTDPLDPSVKWHKELVIADDLCPQGI